MRLHFFFWPSQHSFNMSFQNEVSMLKNEVAQLKQLLLTHKDCPITAMQKESQGYLSKSLLYSLETTCFVTNFALNFTKREKYSLGCTPRKIYWNY